METIHHRRLQRQVHAITEVAKTLTAPLELHQLLEAAISTIIGVVDQADVGVIMLWDNPSGLFRAEAYIGFSAAIEQMGLRAGESITGKVYDTGRPVVINSPETVAEIMGDMRPANRDILARSLGSQNLPSCTLAVPLNAAFQKYGVLVLLTSDSINVFNEEDLPFVHTIADLIALAIDRARLEARADAVRVAQQTERLRSEVMATLSHQLRMHLSAIKGYSTALLLDEIEWNKAKQTEFLELIDEECDSMQAMITEMLDSSLIDVGQLSMELQPLRLPALAHEISAEFQRRTERHHFVVEFPPDFPILDADQRWIKQVFRNIIDNSIKYSPEGGLIVIHGEVRSNDVVVSISDQGVGISPEDLIPLFEKYFRVRSSLGIQVPGTGLGLPVARAIVEAHGGRIWAESKLGQGTNLFFSIPYKQEAEVD